MLDITYKLYTIDKWHLSLGFYRVVQQTSTQHPTIKNKQKPMKNRNLLKNGILSVYPYPSRIIDVSLGSLSKVQLNRQRVRQSISYNDLKEHTLFTKYKQGLSTVKIIYESSRQNSEVT